jgi:amidase
MLPFAVGYDIAGAEEAAAVRRSLRLTLAATFLGLPAVAVPAGTTTVDGRTLPIGVQVIARAGADARALDAAGAIEARLGVVTPLDPR